MSIIEIYNDYVKDFDAEHEAVDNALYNLFNVVYRGNDTLEKIIIKVSALNSLYSTKLTDKGIGIISRKIEENKDIDRILYRDFNNEFIEEDRSVIDYIGSTIDGINNAYVFASKYCSFHNPKKYIIFDRFSWEAMYRICKEGVIQRKIPKYTSTNMDFSSYNMYCECMIELKERYFSDQSYKKIDEFLWKYGNELLRGD